MYIISSTSVIIFSGTFCKLRTHKEDKWLFPLNTTYLGNLKKLLLDAHESNGTEAKL